MSLINAKPTSPGRRGLVRVMRIGIHKGRPLRTLVSHAVSNTGRNNQGRITVRHRGGGHKRLYRVIDFKRADKDGVIGTVERLEYDPNRSAYIALVLYADGERRYIIAPKGVSIGSQIVSGIGAPIRAGSCLPMQHIPVGSVVHCVELFPGRGAQLMRSAGSSAQLLSKEEGYAILRMRSGEVRKVLVNGRACIGEVSNEEHNLRALGKAGATRWLGRRPTVRGVAMNPVDHPHGGGEGKTSGGRHPVSPTGVPAKGYKTRRNKRTSRMIIRDRRVK